MARRRPIEELTPGQRATLAAICRAAGVPPEKWRRVTWLRQTFEVLAVEQLADRLQEPGGPRGPAVQEAAAMLGIPYGTHRDRRQRATAESVEASNGPVSHLSDGPSRPGPDAPGIFKRTEEAECT